MSDPSCRTFRELLGVYVVGAIEPSERAAVDAHLNQCYECREELASLAPLPALLHRVSSEDAERILLASSPPPFDPAEPSAQMLDSLLKRVGARRRTKRFRSLFTAAAAIVIAVGGAIGVSQAIAPHPRLVSVDTATVTSGPLAATVRYVQASSGGTQMSVRVHGFKPWTSCKFWVLTKDGSRYLAGAWIVRPGGEKLWYPAQSHVPEAKVAAFEITWQGFHLNIPAT